MTVTNFPSRVIINQGKQVHLSTMIFVNKYYYDDMNWNGKRCCIVTLAALALPLAFCIYSTKKPMHFALLMTNIDQSPALTEDMAGSQKAGHQWFLSKLTIIPC